MGTPLPTQKITRERINYFMKNIRHDSVLEKKNSASFIYKQMETGFFDQFFSISYSQYHHLTTITICIQIWRETEPFGLVLRPAKSKTWLPTPAALNDRPLMELAVSSYESSLS
jgi:hypothetical protein